MHFLYILLNDEALKTQNIFKMWVYYSLIKIWTDATNWVWTSLSSPCVSFLFFIIMQFECLTICILNQFDNENQKAFYTFDGNVKQHMGSTHKKRNHLTLTPTI